MVVRMIWNPRREASLCDTLIDHLNEWGCDPTPCPAEHVELEGLTKWADPAKCEWRCEPRAEFCEFEFCPEFRDGRSGDLVPEDHSACGWQIRVADIIEALQEGT